MTKFLYKFCNYLENSKKYARKMRFISSVESDLRKIIIFST